MSGGSYDYAYEKLRDFAQSLQQTTPERKAFAELCGRVAKAMHDIEWVDSCDYGKGDENKAIRSALGESADAEIIRAAIADAERSLAELNGAVTSARMTQEHHP